MNAKKETSRTGNAPVRFLRLALILGALIIVGVVGGLVPRWHQQSELRAETASFAKPTVSVVSPALLQSTTGLTLPAEIKPFIEASIYARASGYLKQRYVDIGSHVEADQLLAEIDTPELRQDLARAQAQLAQAEAAMELSKITAARWGNLLKTNSVSAQENAEKQADLKLKTAAADSIRADMRRLEEMLSFARVTAPFAGTITARNIDAGDLIAAAGSKELFHLAQTGKLRVYVQVPQAMARSITADQTAEMTIPELPGKVFTAKVVRTAGSMASDSRTLLVELEVDNPKGEILAGGYAQIRFTEAKMEPTLTLPANALIFRTDGPQIGVVDQDSKVELRNVKLGRDYGKTIEVLTGANEKDRVIVNPSDSLTSGTVVSVVATPKADKNPKAEKNQ